MCWCLICGLQTCAIGNAVADEFPTLKPTFPRLMGMNIGAKNYQDQQYQKDLAKLDVVILGFYPGWNPENESLPIAKVVKRLKTLNPSIMIGQYTILNEAYDNLDRNKADGDKYWKLYQEGWWLKDAEGGKVQWSSEFRTWEVNFTKWAKPDKDGTLYPEWLAKRDYRLYFENNPEFSIWFFDNIFDKPRIKRADWNLDGENEKNDQPLISQEYRSGHAAEWKAARKLAPNRLFMGNSDNDLSSPEYKGKLQGAFLEGMMGKWWSPEIMMGWSKMMERYRSVMANTASPHMVGFNVWGTRDNYRFFRYAFTSCLLDDGYFSFTENDKGYSSVAWFDEYTTDLGQAVDPPPTQPWYKGVYRRRFEKGMVLVNPTYMDVTVNIESGYQTIAGKQDPKINQGRPVTSLTIAGKDGIVLSKYIPKIENLKALSDSYNQ